MPKERRGRSVSFDRSQASPFPSSSSRTRQLKTKSSPESEEDVKEWEEARCPVCIEHPHNAVLLMCSSHKKGCRPYMCDTSYRHSNCLDQFRKSFSETPLQEENTTQEENMIEVTSAEQPQETVSNIQNERSEEGSPSVQPMSLDTEDDKLKLVCPLCRGKVTGWTIVDSARSFMNAKSRSCASETCEFCGTYADLRKHARQEHPLVRPSVADPERERNWRRLERQRDFGDLISTLQSVGEESSEESIPFEDGSWLTVFFLIRVFRPGNSSRSSSWFGSSRARAQGTVRRRSTRLWGETHEGGNSEPATRDGDNNDEVSDSANVSPRTRRWLRRQSTPEDGDNNDEASDGANLPRRIRRRLRRQSTLEDGDNNDESSDGANLPRRTRRRLMRQSTPDDDL